ncbi:MAG: hypothetical protein LBO72_06260 [Helicobacteraceae bacterium]|nr:hypothetical protein [Helicobacteraceae bacterium]
MNYFSPNGKSCARRTIKFLSAAPADKRAKTVGLIQAIFRRFETDYT